MTNKLPALVLDEKLVIDIVAAQAAVLLPRMSSSHANLASMLGDCLRRGDFDVTVKAIHAAENEGDWLADTVLRETCAEMGNLNQPMSSQLDAFWQRAIRRAPTPRGRGRDQYSHWSRDNGICMLIMWTCAEFGVSPTRSRSARHNRVPSGSSLVKKALEKHQINLEEKTVQDKLWGGLSGLLMRRAAAELI